MQAVIDNFSRYVLAAKTSATYGGRGTKQLLEHAIEKAKGLGCGIFPIVLADSGTENINADVDELVTSGAIKRLIAQIEVDFSNSMIEAFFRRMKHGYLYLQRLSSIEAVAEHVDFYLNEHNCVLPHSALGGATPFEVVTGLWTVEARRSLALAMSKNAAARLELNRAMTCGVCTAIVT